MLTMQGGVYLAHRTTESIQSYVKTATNVAALATSLLFAIAGFWVQSLDGYLLVGDIDGGAVIDPLSKQVQIQSGAWLTNFMIILGCGYYPLWGFDASDGDYLIKNRTHFAGFYCLKLSSFGHHCDHRGQHYFHFICHLLPTHAQA